MKSLKSIYKIFIGKLEQLVRLICVNSFTRWNDSVLVIEYPKSGGTWLGQLVSGYLDIPFPRNRFPLLKRSLFHGHYLPKGLITKNKKILLLVRDGRDVMVSFYHHQLIFNDKTKKNPHKVEYYRNTVGFDDYDNVKENMAAYLDYSFTHVPPKTQHFLFHGNWYEFNDAWMSELEKGKGIYLLQYEDLLEDAHGTLTKLFQEFFGEKKIDENRLKDVIQKFSFENQTQRKKGEENTKSFLRKGIRGDWKNYFDDKEKTIFKKHSKNMLVRLGYEKDHNW